MITRYDVIVVGSGIFGLTAVIELRQRGHKVALLDPGPVPHPLAASTDISKVIRMEYGRDALYMEMVEKALDGWQRWNESLFSTKLYHNVGVTMLTRQPMAPGGYEYESYQLLKQRDHRVERLNSSAIADRFPAWKTATYVDGFYHAQGGYAESGRVIEALLDQAQELGVVFYGEQTVTGLVGNGRIRGNITASGQTFNAETVLITAGAWTPTLLPELAPVMHATGHPVFHLKPPDPTLFKPPYFTVFTADVANTGWYGFPLHPQHGIVKIANHGVGQRLHPANDKRVVNDSDIRNLRRFLENTFPALKDAPIAYTRRCLYCDTLDEHLWIDRHPEKEGLAVAAGGSGHGFKFAPILGPLIADALEGKPNPYLDRFRWRDLDADTSGEEAARYHG